MLRNYFVIATRNLLNRKLYSSINILGLSLGIACCLVLSLFVLNELNFDTHHQHASHIYRIVNRKITGNQASNSALTPGILGIEAGKRFAEITASTRVSAYRELVSTGKQETFEEFVLATDADFFNIFTLPLVAGNTILNEKTVLISEATAVKYFGTKTAIGETLSVGYINDLKVTGVYKNIPLQSHLRADVIFSFTHIERSRPMARSWSNNLFYNYLLLNPHADVPTLNGKLDALVHDHTTEAADYRYFLQPLLAIHTDDSYIGNPSPAVGNTMLVALGTVGVIILLLACINYMNMATARSAKRALEVGLRKTMGAYRGQLIRQFLTESLMICTLSFLLGVLWADLALPLFNDFLNLSVFGGNRDLRMSDFFSNYKLLSFLVACNILITLVAGSYPSFFLSRFIPAAVLKGKQVSDASKNLRHGLVVLQFAITGILIVLVLVVFRQVDYIRTKDLGFNKERMILFVAERGRDLSMETFRGELMKIAGVEHVASASTLPGRSVNNSFLRPIPGTSQENIQVGWYYIDHDYIPTFEIPLLAGRNFLDNGGDRNKGVVINELAARTLGWSPEDAIGKKVSGVFFSDSLPGEVIGVVRNFHASSLRKEIAPLVLAYDGSYNTRYMVKTASPDLPHLQAQLRAVVTKLIPGKPFEPYVMNDYLDRVYEPEIKAGQLLTFFTGLALIIGCLGLYALSAYEGERRMKELGIRRIMGATTMQLLTMLSRGFLKPVLIALMIAMPLAYFVANKWLQSFPYHTSWSNTVFLEAACAMLLLGWFTIAAHGVKAARLNPADTLRHE